MKRNLKLLSGVVGFAMLVNVLAFAACTPVEEEPVEENNPPVVVVPEPEIDEADLIYNKDGTFNREGFLRTYNELMDTEMNAVPQTYDTYLNGSYEEYIPFYVYYNKETKAVRMASFGNYKDNVIDIYGDLWTGEFRVVSFPIDMSACETWTEFKEKFVEEVTPGTIQYDVAVKYEYAVGSPEYMEDVEYNDALAKLAVESYTKLYLDFDPSFSMLYFFGEPFEINNGRRMLVPIGTIYIDQRDGNIVQFGVEAWVSTEGGWRENIINGENLNVYPATESKNNIGNMYDESFCDLMYSGQENTVENEEEVVEGVNYKHVFL